MDFCLFYKLKHSYKTSVGLVMKYSISEFSKERLWGWPSWRPLLTRELKKASSKRGMLYLLDAVVWQLHVTSRWVQELAHLRMSHAQASHRIFCSVEGIPDRTYSSSKVVVPRPCGSLLLAADYWEGATQWNLCRTMLECHSAKDMDEKTKHTSAFWSLSFTLFVL